MRLIGLVMFAAAWVLLYPGTSGAHSDLADSQPADGAVVDSPVDAVELIFTKSVEPVVEQFGVAGPEGPVPVESIEPSADGTVLTVRPADSLAGGPFTVKWAIRAGDTHLKTGSLGFEVTATAAQPVVPDPAQPDGLSDAAVGEESSGQTTAAAVGPVVQEPVTDSADTRLAERLSTVFLGIAYAALLFAVGGVAFVAFVLRGGRSESNLAVHLVRRSAALLVLASIVGFVLQLVVHEGGSFSAVFSGSAWADVVTSGHGPTTALRIVGAAMVMTLATAIASTDGRGTVDLRGSEEKEPGGGSGSTATAVRRRRRETVRVAPSAVVWVGAAVLLLSDTFLGHTADTQPRWLVFLSDVVHLAAASVWFGGVALLAIVMRRRARRSGPGSTALVGRFSVAATWALVAVGVTGAVMAFLILGADGASWTSPFALVLFAKVVLVGFAAALGGYNGRVLLPQIEADGDAGSVQRLRTSVTAEAGLFIAVIALTAMLVTSSPS